MTAHGDSLTLVPGIPVKLLRVASGAGFATSHKTVEHYTPPRVINPILTFLGETQFDLDPCADPGKRLPARNHYVFPAQNGLLLPWDFGSVFANPPYGRDGNITAWVRKFCEEPQWMGASEFFLLVKVATDTDWWQPLFQFPRCFIKGRLRFLDVTGKEQGPATFGSALIYRGRHNRQFLKHFRELGHCE